MKDAYSDDSKFKMETIELKNNAIFWKRKNNDLKIKYDLKRKALDHAQSKLKDFHSPVGVAKHIKEFVANDTSFPRCNLTNCTTKGIQISLN